MSHLLGNNERSQLGVAGNNTLVAPEVLPLRWHQPGDALEQLHSVQHATSEASNKVASLLRIAKAFEADGRRRLGLRTGNGTILGPAAFVGFLILF